MCDFDLKKILSRIDEIQPPKSVIRLSVSKQQASIFDSKLGGIPYFPKNMEYPLGKDGEFENQPLSLLTQLNFEQLPHIPDFPTTGILQIFIAPDDVYGMSFKSGIGRTAEDNYRVVYHKEIITDEECLLSGKDIPQYTGNKECYLPFEGEYKLMVEGTGVMSVTPSNYNYNDLFVQAYNETADEPIDEIWDLEDDLIDTLYDMVDFPDAIIGGYPVFVQDDPRRGELRNFDMVLFELDSVYGEDTDISISWGRCGTGSFMISRKDLLALDFSKVLYNYDN